MTNHSNRIQSPESLREHELGFAANIKRTAAILSSGVALFAATSATAQESLPPGSTDPINGFEFSEFKASCDTDTREIDVSIKITNLPLNGLGDPSFVTIKSGLHRYDPNNPFQTLQEGYPERYLSEITGEITGDPDLTDGIGNGYLSIKYPNPLPDETPSDKTDADKYTVQTQVTTNYQDGTTNKGAFSQNIVDCAKVSPEPKPEPPVVPPVTTTPETPVVPPVTTTPVVPPNLPAKVCAIPGAELRLVTPATAKRNSVFTTRVAMRNIGTANIDGKGTAANTKVVVKGAKLVGSKAQLKKQGIVAKGNTITIDVPNKGIAPGKALAKALKLRALKGKKVSIVARATRGGNALYSFQDCEMPAERIPATDVESDKVKLR